MTINQIRSTGFWIIDEISAVSDFILNCVCCRKITGLVQEQEMADLPDD